jgi:hypothetical protein
LFLRGGEGCGIAGEFVRADYDAVGHCWVWWWATELKVVDWIAQGKDGW